MTSEVKQKLHEVHPHLMHYTNAAGLYGIVQSQTLRATHFAYLNDATEVKYFIENKLREIFENITLQFQKSAKIDKSQVRRFVDDWIDKTNKIFFGDHVGKDALVEPYLMSFCTSTDQGARVAANGLLSQWRGYGGQGGYALEFDAKDLCELLTEFGCKYKEDFYLYAGDVVYSSDDNEKYGGTFADDMNHIEGYVKSQLRQDYENIYAKELYQTVMRCACRYKHWGFKEENEVRIIYIPRSKKVIEEIASKNIPTKNIPPKHRVRSGILVPYVELFEGLTSKSRPLPIVRVIVGPCPEHEKAMRIRAVQSLLDENGLSSTKVSASEIPYIGN
jgi:hypothetical protein